MTELLGKIIVHTIWHKHIRLMNDINYLNKNANRKKRPPKTKFYLSWQLFNNAIRSYKATFKIAIVLQIQKDMKEGKKLLTIILYQYPEVEEDGIRHLQYYLNFIKPWLGRL